MREILDVKGVTWQQFCFKGQVKSTPGQALLAIYILHKSDEATWKILS